MLEIVLIILGLVVFICSFFLPAGRKGQTQENEGISQDAIREMVGKEVEEAKGQISDIVNETISYSMEKTERSMDRLTNEKMMAINEYSDTVLEEINKNHKEVVFLYDMLNNKHENLKATVSEAVKAANEVKQTVKDAEITAKEAEVTAREAEEKAREVKETVEEQEFKPMDPERVELLLPEELFAESEESKKEPAEAKKAAKKPKKTDSQKTAEKLEKDAVKTAAGSREAAEEVPEVTVSLSDAGKAGGRNNNERILELHKAGKSNMAIARELGLGIGEVKLVIDLFKGI